MAAMTQMQLCLRPAGLVQRSSSSSRQARVVVRAEAVQKQGVVQAVEQAIGSVRLPAAVKPAAVAVVANVLMALPAHAEAGKIFDFNLTLPIMAGQFLLLMVFLDKTWFGPVGKVLDERDASIRSKLSAVKDNSSDLQALQEQAEKLLSAARADAQKTIQSAKESVQKEQAAKLAAVKERIDKELASSLAALEKEKESALANLDSQVTKLSEEILQRVLPEGVKL